MVLFTIKSKKSRPGYNFKTKEKKLIKERNVVLFKPSKEFKNFINKMINKTNNAYKSIGEVAELLNLKKIVKVENLIHIP